MASSNEQVAIHLDERPRKGPSIREHGEYVAPSKNSTSRPPSTTYDGEPGLGNVASNNSGNERTQDDDILVEPPAALAMNVALVEDIPPDGGYGWVVMICVCLCNSCTWGVNASWAIFLAHYLTNSTFPGATQLHYALIGGLSISQAMMISPIQAILARRCGTKATLLIGTVLVSAAWLTASFATQVWHLFLTVGVCFGWGMGMVYITATSVLPQWFSRRRSLAVGIASAGAGLGGLFYSLLTGWLVQRVGVSWTYRVLAGTTLVINGCSAILLKDRNKVVKPVQGTFNYREFGHVEVLLIIAWGFMTDIGYVVLLFSLPTYAQSIGLSQTQGSVVGAMINLGLAIGRPFIGYYSDALGRINMAGLMTALCGFLCLALWVPAKSFAVLIVFAILAGAVTGIFWGTCTGKSLLCHSSHVHFITLFQDRRRA